MRITGTARLGGTVVAAIVMAALTGHASLWAPAREGVARPLDLLAIVAVAVVIGSIVARLVDRQLRGGRSSPDTTMPTVAVVAVVVGLFGIANVPLYPPPPPTGEAQASDSGRIGVRLESDWVGPAIRRGGEGGGSEFSFNSPDHATFVRALLVFLLVAALAGAVVIARSRKPPEDPSAEPEFPPFNEGARAAAHDAVLVTIDAMLADPDPRTAIIGAYARLLEELEATGAARHDYEGPKEHLHRVLSVLAVPPAPLEMLILLFEEARFSQHALTDQHRDDALRALERVALELSSPVRERSG